MASSYLKQSAYETIMFYQTLEKVIEHSDVKGMIFNIFSGIVAVVISSTIANPAAVVKIRIQAHILSNLLAIKVNDGVLWRYLQTRNNIWFVAGMQYSIL